MEYTPAYTPELNGMSERMNRTLVERAKSMLAESKLSKEMWGEAINVAVYITNRVPTNAVKNKTPYEMWYGSKPTLSNIKIFGCRAYIHIPKEKRSKFDDKSVVGILVGYMDLMVIDYGIPKH